MSELGDRVYFEQSVEKPRESGGISNYTANLSQTDGDVSLKELGFIFEEAQIVASFGWKHLGFYMSVDSFSQEDKDTINKVNPSLTEFLGINAAYAATYFSVSQPLTTFRPEVKATMNRGGIRNEKMPHLFAALNDRNEKGLFIASEFDSDWLLNWPKWEGEGITRLEPSVLTDGAWESLTVLKDILHNQAAETLRS